MDDNAPDARPGKFSAADERIFALLAIVEDQQTAVRAGLQGLAQERAALATERVALVQQAEKMERLSDKIASAILQAIPKLADSAGQAAGVSVTRALQGTVVTAVHAAGVAALPLRRGGLRSLPPLRRRDCDGGGPGSDRPQQLAQNGRGDYLRSKSLPSARSVRCHAGSRFAGSPSSVSEKATHCDDERGGAWIPDRDHHGGVKAVEDRHRGRALRRHGQASHQGDRARR